MVVEKGVEAEGSRFVAGDQSAVDTVLVVVTLVSEGLARLALD